MVRSFLGKLLLHGKLVPGAHQTGRVEPGGLLKVLPAHLGLSLPPSHLRHAPGEVLGAGVEVHDHGEVDLGLQAGRGADRHAGALALDAQLGFSHAGQSVALLLLLLPLLLLGGEARLRPPVPELLLGRLQKGEEHHSKVTKPPTRGGRGGVDGDDMEWGWRLLYRP